MAVNLNTSLSMLAAKGDQTKEDAAKAKKDAKLTEACQQFEAMFLRQLFKEMRQTVDKNGLLSGGYGEEIFQEMLDGTIADEAVKGSSVGLAEMLEAQLTQKLGVRPSGNLHGAYSSSGTSQAADELVMPVEGQVSSHYGMRAHPISGDYKHHDGLDLAAAEGSAVKAAKAGVVRFAGENGGYGNMVVISHPDGSETAYGHLKDFSVSEGQTVAQGQQIGRVGSTGVSTGPHLHFEVRLADGTTSDPEPMLAKSHSTVA